GFAIAPIRDGELLNDEQFEKLPPDEQERTRQAMSAVSDRLRQHIERLPQWHKERRERIKSLNRAITNAAADPAIRELEAHYADLHGVVAHLRRVREDVLENAHLCRPDEPPMGPILPPMAPPVARPALTQDAALRRYAVNVVVDHEHDGQAPIVYEQHPSLANLVGRIEH